MADVGETVRQHLFLLFTIQVDEEVVGLCLGRKVAFLVDLLDLLDRPHSKQL